MTLTHTTDEENTFRDSAELHERRAYTRAKREWMTRAGVTVRKLSYYGKNKTPPTMEKLDPAEEKRLFLRMKRGDVAARERLVRQYLCWAFKIASKMKGPRLDHDEAIGAANAGLMEALDGFDAKLGTRFIVYSYRVIQRHVIEALISTYPVHVSEHYRAKLRKGQIRDPFATSIEQNEPQTVEDFFSRLGETPDFDPTALHERPEDCAFMPAAGEQPSDALQRLSLSTELHAAMKNVLTGAERRVIVARYGKDVPEPYEALGMRLKLAKNRVREIHDMALVKLRRHLSSTGEN